MFTFKKWLNGHVLLLFCLNLSIAWRFWVDEHKNDILWKKNPKTSNLLWSFQALRAQTLAFYTLLDLSDTEITLFIFCTRVVQSVLEKFKLLHQVVILLNNCRRQIKTKCLVGTRQTFIHNELAIRNLQWRTGKGQINSISELPISWQLLI